MNNLLEAGLTSELFDFISKAGSRVIKAAKEKDKNSSGNVYLGGSIANKTKNLVMTFPCLCDNSLPPSTVSMINKANERNIVTMLQLLFTSMSINSKDGVEVLSRIHKNINASMSMDDVIDSIDNFVDSTGIMESAEIKRAIREINEMVKLPQKSFPVESLNERSLNDYTVLNLNGNMVVREDATSNPFGVSVVPGSPVTPVAPGVKPGKPEDNEYSLTAKLLDSDVKKANEMTPSLMVIQYNEIAPDGTTNKQRPFIAGVKSRLIPVESTDIVDRVIVKNKTKVNFLNLVRAFTGEIGFVKDFILCIDQAKIDAKNSVKKGPAAQMWKVLETRSSKNYINKAKRAGNDASAITTLVINQETVNLLKKQYNFDIEKISNARLILESYNLLGIIIADESIEVVKFLYDGNDSFEQQAYSFLEREAKDNSYKKIINLIGKMNGR